jgi:Na+/H+ antiporter NhaD/arsenite permease-like protein
VGANHIAPIDIMAFFISLAYIAISIDASGLIRWMACKVLQKGARHGHRLFFYLYTFFFAMACFVGNDPIVLYVIYPLSSSHHVTELISPVRSGTAFLAYMTRVASNITNEKAWIYSQFAMANVGSAVLVSSNPTNLVLAGAFHIKFIAYTANVIVPVLATVVILFPFLLYLLFRRDGLVSMPTRRVPSCIY